MNSDLISAIQTFTLIARAALEKDAGEQLEGIYGWLPDGGFAPTKNYPAIAQLAEAKETRCRLERFVEDDKAAGFDAKSARRKLIRETAFTWLNRLAAFRLLEERKLLKRTIVRLAQSNGFIFWLTDENNVRGQEAYALHQRGGLPLNAMGEGPSDIAYRRFLLWQCGKLARDISVLFDPDTLASRLCPRPRTLKQLVESMNAEKLAEAWKPGSEETIGWMYEGFVEEENKDVFDKFSKGKKVLPDEIGAATQRFTPRWIVRFLVENSLGRVWLEMHPESRLAGSLSYFVPAEKKATRPVKPVRDIDFLDPACGSMHFGLVAFDLFAEMYREELQRAGQPGWPAKASVEKVEDIPASIVRHNLFGIDLDLRAVQIATLTMLIKAWTIQPGCAVTDLNFACADMEQISGGRLEAIISQAKFKHPIYERVLRGLVGRMKNSDQLGSLLRPEKVLEELIAEERRKAEANLFLLPGLMPDQFKTPAGVEEFFSTLSEHILEQLDGMIQTSRAAGQDPGHLVAEASKGLRFLRLVSRHYDVVATNPPYMSRRNMSAIMATHLDDQFKEGKGDLYAAFIARCGELADLGGKVAMVTQQSFMFISSYEDLRAKLRDGFAIEAMAHLGPKAFPNITGEKVNTTAFVFEKRASKGECDRQNGVYFRLVREPDADGKRRAFEAALAADTNTQAQPHALLFRCRQQDFDTIPGKPWVYWITASLRAVFEKCPSLGDRATVRKGLATCDNNRFVRYWWEVGKKSLRLQSKPATHDRKWNPYVKGGGFRRWYGNQDYVVNWLNNGLELRTYVESINQPVAAEGYFFRPGITYSYLTSGRFCARKLLADFIFDAAGSSLFTKLTEHVLGVLNSEPAFYFLRLINPTVNFQAGDLRRLPIPDAQSGSFCEKVVAAISAQANDDARNELARDFVRPWTSATEIQGLRAQLATLESAIDEEVYSFYGIRREDKAEIRKELSESPSDGNGKDHDSDFLEGEPLEVESEDQGIARSWVSYAVGTVLGRFEIGKPAGLGGGDFPVATVTAIRALIDPDGIIPCDPGHKRDIAARAIQCLTLMLGDADARDAVHTATSETGDPVEAMRAWLDRFTGTPDKSFWKYHFQLYRKHPVYWPIQSPKKKFTVWLFQERLTKDTLFTVKKIVDDQLRLVERAAADLRPQAQTNRSKAKDLERLLDTVQDLREFSNRINGVIQRGYTPHIDDGVLLNAAPLWELLPSWPETKKAWEELEAGDYDWAQQAMEYWPKRVKEKCKTNKSFAIAHGLA